MFHFGSVEKRLHAERARLLTRCHLDDKVLAPFRCQKIGGLRMLNGAI